MARNSQRNTYLRGEAVSDLMTLDGIKEVADQLLDLPQVDVQVKHSFAPGVYIREMIIPAGTFVIGNEHRTEHFNLAVSGKCRCFVNGFVRELNAKDLFVSDKNVMKVAFVTADLHFMTIHATDETNVDKLEEMLFVKTPKRMRYESERKLLMNP